MTPRGLSTVQRRIGQTLLLALASACSSAWAGDVEVRVLDADGRPLRDAAVFLESPEAAAAARPAAQLDIAQTDKRFVPMVSILPVGSAVNFPNRDTVRHHVYSFSSTKRFEIKLYVGTPTTPVMFDRAGIAVLGCNIHDHMAAWVVVVATPWYAKTDETGVARIRDVAQGAYRLRSWHPSMPVGDPAEDQALRVEAKPQRLEVRLASARP